MKKIILIIALIMSYSLFANDGVSPTSHHNQASVKNIKFEAISIKIPNNWYQSPTNKKLWTDGLGNSVNITSENSGTMPYKDYIDLSLKNMKKMLPSYKILKESKGKGLNIEYDYFLGEYSLKDIGAKTDGTIKLYSIFIDDKNMKYVVTIGGLPKSFKEMSNVFDSMMKSIKFDASFKKLVDDAGGIKTINGAMSFNVPKGWAKKEGRDMWIDPNTNSSVNVITETTTMSLKDYLALSLKNMKKAINTYVLIKEEVKVINGNKVGILLGEFTMSGMAIKLYSLVLDINGTKYVLSIGGPKKSFSSLNKEFTKTINSIKKL